VARQVAWWAGYLLQLRAPVVIPWYERLRLRIYLSRDSSRPIFTTGRYEPNEMSFFRGALKPGMVVLDVGANEGFYTILAARAVGTEGIVVAVEPSAREVGKLEQNLVLNHLDNVRVMPVALLEDEGTATLHTATAQHSGHNTFGDFATARVSPGGDREVRVTSMDRLVADLQLGRLDFIKADIEGAEARMLAGGAVTLNTMRPLVLMELQDRSLKAMGSSAPAVLQLLNGHDYVVLTFDATGSRLTGSIEGAESVVAVPRERLGELERSGLARL
jgi:FkbM family methyltransferase